jgi:hypothetical protein
VKKLQILGAVAALLIVTGGYALLRAHTFTGEITDGTCGNNGSHMMMPDAGGNPVDAARKCTMGCVKLGETYVLYNANTKALYDLSDQKTPEQFAGEQVIVTGTLNKSTMMIKVLNIRVASTKSAF